MEQETPSMPINDRISLRGMTLSAVGMLIDGPRRERENHGGNRQTNATPQCVRLIVTDHPKDF